jgi:hypothetical protein
MADSPEPATTKSGHAVVGNATAPFIYCDGVGTYGVHGGVIQVELAAATVLPIGDGGTRTEFVVTAHLRCSASAALNIKDAIEKALEMLKKPADSEAPAGATLN